jgi:purine-binding chemotaxis protein CheW
MRARAQAARASADAQEDMSEITSQQLVVFSIGTEEYALPIGAVHEIIRFTEPRSVASEVPWIRGVIGLRGKIIPIYDLATRIGIDVADAEFGKIVIVETGTGQAGMVVGDVEEVLTVTADQLEAVPTADSATIESIAKIGDRLVILLNPESLFTRAGADEITAVTA